jgi:hypothetical protein
MFAKLFRTMYSTVFVNIVVSRSETSVYIEVTAHNKVAEHLQKSFRTLSINKKMIDFILTYIRDTPYFYISLLDKSSSQGAIGSCSKKQMAKYCDLENSKYMCTKNKWAFYTSAYDLQTTANRYKIIGLDFIFSPFVILSLFFQDKIDSKLAIYVLIEDGYLSVSVFDHKKLLFAIQLNMANKNSDEPDFLMAPDDKEFETDLPLEEVEAEENNTDLFDNLNNIEDLSSYKELTEFDDEKDIAFKDIKEESNENFEGDFNEDYQRYLLIQNAIKLYYKDEKSESNFLEDIYIANNVQISRGLKKHLEEEMCLNVVVRKINLGIELCKLAKAEIS